MSVLVGLGQQTIAKGLKKNPVIFSEDLYILA